MRSQPNAIKGTILVLLLTAALVSGIVWHMEFADAAGTAIHSPPDTATAGAQIQCPEQFEGLYLDEALSTGTTGGGGTVRFECIYVLDPTRTPVSVRANVLAVWNENGRNQTLVDGCGLPEVRVWQTHEAMGTLYSAQFTAQVHYTGGRKYGGGLRSMAAKLLSAVEGNAHPCQGVPLTSAPSPAQLDQAATAEPLETRCAVHGRVTDRLGAPVSGIRVQMETETGDPKAEVITDERGRYYFPNAAHPGAIITVFTEHFSHEQHRFTVHHRQQVGTLSIVLNETQYRDGACRVDFDAWSLGDDFIAHEPSLNLWPDIIEIYQNTRKAWALADLVEVDLDYGLPLDIYAWCDSPDLYCAASEDAHFAFYAGGRTGHPYDTPYFALAPSNSRLDDPGRPDNREYHEFGHVFLTDLFSNEAPFNSGDQNHGGYYRNSSTTDSWFEGFAEFYSMMVSKHIDDDPRPERYKIGAEYDLEVDHPAWEAWGWWEEFSLAGLLLDFVDGDSDYSHRRMDSAVLEIDEAIIVNLTSGQIAMGLVRNVSGAALKDLEVTVHLLDSESYRVASQVTSVRPGTLLPEAQGAYYVAAPPGTQLGGVEVEVGGIPMIDDDPIQVDLQHLISVIESFDSPNGNGHLFNVAELYTALSDAFAGENNIGGTGLITRADIDQVFISHGFFEDLDGDLTYNPARDGAIGLSSHPEREAGGHFYRELEPRHSADPYPASLVDVYSKDDVATEALIQVSFPEPHEGRSYAYVMPLSGHGQVELAVPPTGYDASVTVLALAPGHTPEIALYVDADDYHATVAERPDEPFLQSRVSEVALQRGGLFAPYSNDSPAAPAESNRNDGANRLNAGWMAVAAGLGSALMLGGLWAAISNKHRTADDQ
ncbi:MAG: carboxypeptidase-like regulatory domain-containing protein [Dehalococcoidia bacterium]